jgi:hypothetical protein
MLGYIAAVIFAIAFLINATSTSTDAVFSPDQPAAGRARVPRAASRRSRHRLVLARARQAPLTAGHQAGFSQLVGHGLWR